MEQLENMACLLVRETSRRTEFIPHCYATNQLGFGPPTVGFLHTSSLLMVGVEHFGVLWRPEVGEQ